MKKLFTFFLALAAGMGTMFAESGTCGENLTWELTDDGVLTISGTGAMYDWEESSTVPWYSYRENITSVIIGNSVTSIGEYAFHQCTGLTSINVANDNSYYSSIDGVLFDKDKTRLIQYPGGKEGNYYVIPNSVTSI